MIKCTERSGVYQAVKRLFDILASLAALVVLSPLFLVIAILILSEDGRPVFYKHTRVGKGGKTFQMYKFRTMYQDRRIVLTPEQQVEPDERRFTYAALRGGRRHYDRAGLPAG